VSGRQRLATLLGAVVLLSTGTPAGSAVPNQPAAATPPGSTTLSSPKITLTSSTHRRLQVSVFLDRYSYRVHHPSTSLQVIVANGRRERHNWNFDVPKAAFIVDGVTGDVAIRPTRRGLLHLGRIALTATAVGNPRTRSCTGGVSETIQDEALHGTFFFSTGARPQSSWGTIGHKSKNTVFRGSSRLVTTFGDPANCLGGTPAPCSTGVQWSELIDHGAGRIDGGWVKTAGKRSSFIEVDDNVKLDHYGDVNRFDDAYRPAPRPDLSRVGDSATLKLRSGGRHGLSGSATVQSTRPSTTVNRCGGPAGGVSIRSWPASLTNGSHPLTVHMAVGPDIATVDASHGADIDVMRPNAAA